MPPVLLLDYDGTLARTDEAVARCMADTFRAMTGAPPAPDHLAGVIGRGLLIDRAFAELLEEEPGDRNREATRRYLAAYPDYDRQYAQPFPGARETLAALRDRAIPLVLLTNKMTVNAELSLGHVGLRDLIDRVIGAEPGLPGKPDPRIFAERVAPLYPDRPRAEFIMVGDTEADLGFARAAGLRAVWASYGFGNPAACAALGPAWRIDALPELLDLPF